MYLKPDVSGLFRVFVPSLIIFRDSNSSLKLLTLLRLNVRELKTIKYVSWPAVGQQVALDSYLTFAFGLLVTESYQTVTLVD